MKVTALWGKAKIGKTTTLKILIQKCVDSGVVKLFDDSKTHRGNPTCVFQFAKNRVCIGTGGDGLKWVKYNYDIACKYSCDILITATRTKGKLVEAWFAKLGISASVISWVRKLVEPDVSRYGIVNELQAQELFDAHCF